jgi:hypothetical protein
MYFNFVKFVATKKLRQQSSTPPLFLLLLDPHWKKIRIRTNIDMPHLHIYWLLFVLKCKYTVEYSRDRSSQILYCNMKHTYVEESGASNNDENY